MRDLTTLTFDVGMRRGDRVLWPSTLRLRDLIAIGINNAGACLVPGLELNLALESLDLLLVQEVAVLVTILNALLARENLMTGLGRCARDIRLCCVVGLIPCYNRDLGLLTAANRDLLRRWGCLGCWRRRYGAQRGIGVVLLGNMVVSVNLIKRVLMYFQRGCHIRYPRRYCSQSPRC